MLLQMCSAHLRQIKQVKKRMEISDKVSTSLLSPEPGSVDGQAVAGEHQGGDVKPQHGMLPPGTL